jgi:hypothetical protein
VTSIVEEVRVDVKGDRDAGVAEDAADLATSRPRSTIRWLAKVWRRSWKRSTGRPSPLSPPSSAALFSTSLATFRSPRGVPREVAKTQLVAAGKGVA